MEIKGRVIFNLGIQSGTSKAGKAWSKASVVIETEGQYPKKVMLDNLKNAEEFAKLTPGTVGTFHIEVSSNEYNGRWYTSVNCYKWEAATSPYPQQPPTAQPYYGNPQYAQPVQAQPIGYPQQGAGPMYGQPPMPTQGNPATPNLNSLGVTGYQNPGNTVSGPVPAEADDLPF